MPRQSRPSARAPTRPTVASPRAPAPPQQQQTRPAATLAAPPTSAPSTPNPMATPQTPAASQGPGLFGQMASTAAGVAVGSTVGHVIGSGIAGLFGGSGSSEPAAAQTNTAAADQNTNRSWGNNCQGATEQFTKCLDEHGGNMQICGWYLEQLKACQAAASQFSS
ncbi:hypothetical protein VTJ49DRAFT_4315 [Mycothermus thermophilus]|uniref:CHCH domain-containing protein n=1 Tax=Humicola insolens TaxID=85995 RepID=A0ABR3V7K5_HUMIN